MPKYEAALELPFSRDAVWEVVSEPYHLPDWWPSISGVEPDRRGFAPGARWRIVGDDRPSLLRKPQMSGALLVTEITAPELFAFHLTGDRIHARLRLESLDETRTAASLRVEAPWLIGMGRRFPLRALLRLRRLCETRAGL